MAVCDRAGFAIITGSGERREKTVRSYGKSNSIAIDYGKFCRIRPRLCKSYDRMPERVIGQHAGPLWARPGPEKGEQMLLT